MSKAKDSVERPTIAIKVRNLAEGDHPIEIKQPVSILELPLFTGDLTVRGTVTKHSDRFTVDVVANATGDFECTRCNDPFRRLISAHLKVEFVPPSLSKLEDENEDVHVYDAFLSPTIDITGDVRDALVLAVPMRNLCREDCKGLCPTCGKNLNKEECACLPAEIDDQWSALKSLQERLRAEENKGFQSPK